MHGHGAAGHSHSYFRSPPTYANMTVPHGLPSIPRETVFNPHSAATTYITAGGAGCDEMTWVNKTHADPDKDCDAQGVCLRRRPGAPVREGDGNPKQVVKSSRLISGVLTVVSGKELRYTAIASTPTLTNHGLQAAIIIAHIGKRSCEATVELAI